MQKKANKKTKNIISNNDRINSLSLDIKKTVQNTINNKVYSVNISDILLLIVVLSIFYIIFYHYGLLQNRKLDNIKLSTLLYMIGAILALFRIFELYKYKKNTSSILYIIGFILLNIKNILTLIGQ